MPSKLTTRLTSWEQGFTTPKRKSRSRCRIPTDSSVAGVGSGTITWQEECLAGDARNHWQGIRAVRIEPASGNLVAFGRLFGHNINSRCVDAADIRAGTRRPHPRHWEALAQLVGVTEEVKLKASDQKSVPSSCTENAGSCTELQNSVVKWHAMWCKTVQLCAGNQRFQRKRPFRDKPSTLINRPGVSWESWKASAAQRYAIWPLGRLLRITSPVTASRLRIT
jgi:hypothetical protein